MALARDAGTPIVSTMKRPLESVDSPEARGEDAPVPGWVRVGLIAVASAVAGGMAAAWWYRKTIDHLQQAGENPENTNFSRLETQGTEED